MPHVLQGQGNLLIQIVLRDNRAYQRSIKISRDKNQNLWDCSISRKFEALLVQSIAKFFISTLPFLKKG